MKKILLFTALLCATTIIANDELFVVSNDDNILEIDSVELSRRGPIMKIVQSVSCPVDSIVGLDPQNQYVSKEIFKYDSKGRTILDSVCTWSGTQWVNTTMNQTAYANNGKTSLSASWKWDGEAWVGLKKMEYDYDSNGNTILVLQLSTWKDGNWSGLKSDYKNTWIYNANKKPIRKETYSWGTSDWENSTATDYNYYTSGKDSVVVDYTGEGNLWLPQKETLTQYDTYGNLVLKSVLTEYDANNLSWSGNSGSTKEIYKYNSAKKQLLKEKYSWDISKNNWKGSENKVETKYNTQNKDTLQITYKWDNSTWDWVLSDKVVNIYDAKNHLIESKTKYTWNTTSNSWVGSGTRTVNGYDENGNKSEITTYTWSDNRWKGKNKTISDFSGKIEISRTTQTYVDDTWVNSSRIVHYYDGTTLLQDTTYKWDKTNSVWINSTYVDYSKGNKTFTYTWQSDAWTVSNITGDSASVIYKDGLVVESSTYTWSYAQDRWNGKNRTLNYYDEQKRDTLVEAYVWGTDDWKYSYIQRKKYDSEGYKILEERLDWKNNVWTPNFKYEYEYDKFGNQTHQATYGVSGTNWFGSSCWYRTYDENGNLLSYTSSVWVNNNWVENVEYVYETISKVNSIVERTTELNNVDGKLVNTKKTEVTKDIQGRKISTKVWNWFKDNEDDTEYWCMRSRDESGYDESGEERLRYNLIVDYSSTDCEVIKHYDMQRYYYSCDNYYTIRFLDWDDTELESQQVLEGDKPFDDNIRPTRQDDAQYTYEFNGWDKELVAATSNAVYTAVYTQTTKQYTVIFKDEAGNEWQKSKFDYGTEPVYTNMTPTKDGDAQFTYSFAGWGDGLLPVHGDTAYIAKFDVAVNKYNITFSYGEQSHIETLEYGALIATEWVPELINTAEFEYSFVGWKELAQGATVAGTASYEADVTATKRSYDITFSYGEQSHIETLEYGALIATEWVPELINTAEFEYSFVGWKELAQDATVAGTASYEADVTATKRSYDITFVVGEENYSTSLQYGTSYAVILASVMEEFGIVENEGKYQFEDADFIYTFIGWEEVEALPETVTESATYTMRFGKEAKVPTGVESVENEAATVKVYENGVLYILRNGKKFTTTGTVVE